MKEDKIKEELSRTINNHHYNGWHNRTTFGYHSYNIDDINIVGQRNPLMRLNSMRNFLDFKDKIVVDFGCNVGAMLHHLTEIKKGIGLDYDSQCINAAKNISSILNKSNLDFHVHDFDKENYEIMKSKINIKPDIVFILSLGSWVKSWKNLYKNCLEYNCDIVLEINNVEEGKSQLDFFKNNDCEIKLIIDNSLDDSTGNNRRKTYLINKKK